MVFTGILFVNAGTGCIMQVMMLFDGESVCGTISFPFWKKKNTIIHSFTAQKFTISKLMK